MNSFLQVIKALYDYDPDPAYPQELPFQKGDFFHVISREDDRDWYEACNPLLPNARGLVPVSYFEIIGKNERESTGSMPSRASTGPVDSGYSESGSSGGHTRTDSVATAKAVAQPSQGGATTATKGPMVYGVMKYKFTAERPDELEAAEGEDIILIAQSNPEWYVAKPIKRLGGPGLIPVSFVEIRFMATGEPAKDAIGAVQAAGIPKVEEWKRMAADYKAGSIELGKLSSTAAGTDNVQRDLGRMSLNNRSQQSQNTNGDGQGGQNGAYDYQQNGNGQSNQQQRNSTPAMLAPVSASIPRYCFENDKYWYIIECVMEDGRHWELARYYENFYDFQVALLLEFPEEAGQTGKERKLPYMPGPVTYVTDAISNGRRESLNQYVKELLGLPPRISKCHLVRQLFAPREGDFELDPRAIGEDYRLSGVSQQSSQSNALSRTASQKSSRGQLNGNGYPSQALNGSSQSSRINHPQNQTTFLNNSAAPYPLYRTPSADANSHRSPSSASYRQPKQQQQQQQQPQQYNNGTANQTGAKTIKFFFENECFRIRIPVDISFAALRNKIIERCKIQDEFRIAYKNELTGEEDLEVRGDKDVEWVLDYHINPKAILYVEYV
ncbi:bud emergence protein 1 [Agyrium rufum]|nr:bud emergence protein 1 [Agyrium rufum]